MIYFHFSFKKTFIRTKKEKLEGRSKKTRVRKREVEEERERSRVTFSFLLIHHQLIIMSRKLHINNKL